MWHHFDKVFYQLAFGSVSKVDQDVLNCANCFGTNPIAMTIGGNFRHTFLQIADIFGIHCQCDDLCPMSFIRSAISELW